MEIYNKTITELESMLDAKQLSAVELAKAFIDRKNAVDASVGVFICADEVDLLASAE